MIDFSKLPQKVMVHLIGLDNFEFISKRSGKENAKGKSNRKDLKVSNSQEFGIQGDDNNKLSQLTTYWGKINFEGNVKVSDIRFIESEISNDKITFESKLVVMDPETIRSFKSEQLVSPCESFIVLIPDEIAEGNATFKKETLVVGTDVGVLEFNPKVFSKNEIGIITSATSFKASIDQGVEKIEYPFSVTVEASLEEEIKLEFIGDNWKDLKDKFSMKMNVPNQEKVTIEKRPENVELEISSGDQGQSTGDITEDITGDNTDNDKSEDGGDGQGKKLGPGPIVGIVIACIIVVVAVIVGVVFILKRKNRDALSSSK
ncbi:hypothetical protein TRFO_42878 [Tritrichomonas foetus]|uniref:Uncharacterized protein n=1 Tax=Tritrichomonas foetus TaxID=1144522 RepID=A0A1J4KYM2_9EUKA|nr:hypothetical protein TRFO_42878 [Tritrichomonas foetus]|eukprot:OHT14804.1 hypothetical protein TRFO_42878 [Tritrichomonas foetus]